MFKKFNAITISLLDPRKAISLSYGEVINGKTLNASTLKPEQGGLLCQRIFGPVDYGVCACNKYHPDYKKRQIRCPECGVSLVDPHARRQRLGHISLATPVVHPWYRKIIATLLNIPPRKLDSLIEYDAYMVISPGKSSFKKNEIISSSVFFSYSSSSPEDKYFRAESGGALIKRLLQNANIDDIAIKLKKENPSRRINKRLIIAKAFKESRIKPEWMVLDLLLVLPPDLRTVLVMDDGTIASSDLNELYAKVIHANNRLKRHIYHGAPRLFLVLNSRALQKSVDALMLNKGKNIVTNRSGTRVLSSLSDQIEGKEGRIRRNLLGKRVDYSGRSVIVVGPELKLHQCGLPIELAMDMLRPFIYSRLRKMGYASSLKHASSMVNERTPATLDALEYELAEKVVLLNRAPTLHRLGIQAFEPVLVPGRAIRLHPMVCSAFNADFDGDQMGVHYPVTLEAQIESRVLMLSVNNIFSPTSGKLSVLPSQDIVLGIYCLTKELSGETGEGKVFADKEDALVAHEHGAIKLNALIKLRNNKEFIETTAGRIIFSEVFPWQMSFDVFNKDIKKKDLASVLGLCYKEAGLKATVATLDKVKELGFKYATHYGISFGMDDIVVPKEKPEIIASTEKQTAEIEEQFRNGFLEEEEKHNKIVVLWLNAIETMTQKMIESYGLSNTDGKPNSLFMMADSGARGSNDQMRQLSCMRGIMTKPTGEIVEIPIKSSLKEGLTTHEFLLSAHGARKGRADGALKTANAGYFTRKLVDVAHDIIINADDCEDTRGITVTALYDEHFETIIPLKERIIYRMAAADIKSPATGEIIVRANEIISPEAAFIIDQEDIPAVKIRSPLTCNLKHGICKMCYGWDLAKKDLPELGDAVGIIAAQSIGEPGTQLTLRTFHTGGSASGLGAKSELKARQNGTVRFINTQAVKNREGKDIVVNTGSMLEINNESYRMPCGAMLFVKDNDNVQKNTVLAEWDPDSIPVIAVDKGVVEFVDIEEGLTCKSETSIETGITRTYISSMFGNKIPRIVVSDRTYHLPSGAVLMVKKGETVYPGDLIAKVVKKQVRSADITSGLGRVLQVFEVRKLQSPALIAEIDGTVKIKPHKKGFVVLEITGRWGDARQYVVPVEKQMNNCEGDFVKAGDILVDGVVNPKDVLRVLGMEAAVAHVIGEIQKIYRAQGVEINDKHFEIILRKMLGKVRILSSGDTDLITDELVSREAFFKANKNTEGRKATAKQVIIGLTKAALLTESWLSAASFQSTVSVLADAAIKRKEDLLKGVKENVIIGNIVPVGTGHEAYENISLVNKTPTREKRGEAVTIKRKKEAYKRLTEVFGE